MSANFQTALRVATLNVRGLGARRRQCQLNRLFQDNELHVVAVQETKIESEEHTDNMVSSFRAHYNVCVSHAVGTSGGCAVFIRRDLGVVEEAIVSCVSGRLLVVDFALSAMSWRIICVYAPNNEAERKVFFERLEQYLNTEKMVIVLGDFNCVCFAADRAKNRPVRDKSALFLSELVHDYNLEDIGQVLHSDVRPNFTHFQGESNARLDRVYVSLELLPKCNKYDVKPVSFSDHSLVMFEIGKIERKTRFNWDLWKFNAQLLNDEPFVNAAKEKMNQLLTAETITIAAAWEVFKGEIKTMAIERSCILRHDERKKELELQQQLQFFVSMEGSVPGKFTKQIREVKNHLEALDIARYRAAAIRARSSQLWVGETPTKRALADERRYASKNEIKAIFFENEVQCENDKIKQAFVEHYNKLLGQTNRLKEGFEKDFLPLMPILSRDIKKRLEEPICLKEVENAIDELSPGKSPGPDGLGASFYKTFKFPLAIILNRLFVEAYDVKQVPPSFRAAHMVLIPKTDDQEKLQSVEAYRPISLTNVDYKIFMKILAKRMQSVIKELVGPHQTCGIQNRSISTNIHVARSVLECVDAFAGRVAMLQLDLAKAFDRVTHDILLRLLEYVNVGDVILQGVKMVYTECSTRIIVNKSLTEPIQVRSSVKQGCPLAPLLFALYLEPFCLRVIKNENVRGFKLLSAEVKLLAYADDVAVFCDDRESLMEVVRVATAYCDQTGSQINWRKCQGFWHGAWDCTPERFANIEWSVVPVKYLGVPLNHYRESKQYWLDETEKIREKAAAWQGRDLSMFARAAVCNVFLIAKVWYVLSFLCMPRVCLQKLNRVFAVFIWNSTWERVSRTNLFRRVREGGLGLSHLFLRQLVNRFFFVRDQSNDFLQTVIQVRLMNFIPQFIVSSVGGPRQGLNGYLKEVTIAFKMLQSRFSFEYLSTITKKKLYRDLVDTMLPAPLYRTVYSQGPGQDVLKRVKRMPVRSTVKTFFFKLHTSTLPVNAWLQEKGFFVPWTINCTVCKKPETIEHVFLDCLDPIFFWDVLQRTLKKELPLTPHGIRYLSVVNDGGIPYDMFMLFGLHSLWKTRMGVRHADLNARPVRENFIESMVQMRELYSIQSHPPDWVAMLNDLASLKRF